MSQYAIKPKNKIDAVSANQAIMKMAIDLVTEKVKGLSKLDKKQIQGEMYGMLIQAFEATEVIDTNQLSLFDDDKIK